ncbi:MAG: DNA polymerase III subunit delta [Elusimicrobia bacterium]|nr:DNA polymerase III subunit delta [Elusimicrobiota bacterium]
MDQRPLSSRDLLKEWAAGKFRKVYYLMGQPDEVKDAVAELKLRFKADAFNLGEFTKETDAASAAVSDALTQPMFADRRLVIVGHPKIAKADPEPFVEYLKDPLATTTLVIASDDRKPGAKDKIAALAFQHGAVCVFYALRDYEARGRLVEEARKLGKSLDPDAAEFLVEEAGLDGHILRQELEKAALFVGAEKSITRSDLLACLGYSRGADPYLLSRHIGQRDLKRCLSHLKAVFSSGRAEDHVFQLLAQMRNAVSKQLRAKRMLRRGADEDAVLEEVAVARKKLYEGFLQWLAPLSEARLKRDLGLCLRAEADLKSKTWLDARQETERLVVELCRSRPA